MNWTNFQTYNDAPTKAFEVLCNQLFENWCKNEYSSKITSFGIVNGTGGDGGVESYTDLNNGDIVGMQAKWFPSAIGGSQINQIKKSIQTAMQIRPRIVRYIVCIPRDLGSITRKGRKTEDLRWNELIETLNSQFPSLIIDLWNEARLVTELQKPSSAGIFRFWFGKSEISEESAWFSFRKSKNSWLSTKYVPELNTFGEIDNCISAFLGDAAQRNDLKQTFKDLIALCENLEFAISELISICGENDPQLSNALSTTQNQFAHIQNESCKILSWINNETTVSISFDESTFWINSESIIEFLKESKEEYNHYFHFSEITKILRNFEKIDIQNALGVVGRGNSRKSLLFLGEPGTGKTHGVAAEAEKLFQDGYHIPILIQARDIPTSDNWKDILISVLGLSSDWSEEEIWQALSSLSNRKRYIVQDSKGCTGILSKVVIIVDAIDESSLHQKWIERIQETIAITQEYPLIKFCFTSRPYVFGQAIRYATVIDIGISGDVPCYKLFQNYTNAYNINVKNAGWLQYALTTPLALKLFCDLNKDKTIEYCDRASNSITKLLQEKINVLETEFCTKTSIGSASNQYILRTIQLLSSNFNTEPRVERNALVESIKKQLLLDDTLIDLLLKYLENYGILRLFCEHGLGYLSTNIYYYYPGIQGYFDYASALILINIYKDPKNIDFEKCKYLQQNTLYALAIISIQDFDYLITSNTTIDNVAEPWFKEELYHIALRHTTQPNADKYKNLLLETMASSAESLMSITNNVVLPLSRNFQHPLGSALLDDFLSGFSCPASRDVLWSIPPFLKGSYVDKWFCTHELALKREEYSLVKVDVAEGCPLIYAWALASVDNSQRKLFRKALMQWALLVPSEFYKLFLRFSFVNDPQIRSDLFSILMCLVFEDENRFIIEEAANWLMKNVLSSDKIDGNRDIAIRYYSCAIIRKAVYLGIIDQKAASSFLPPYNQKNLHISLCREALSGTRMGGYSAIHYDLARYVLIDHLVDPFTSCFSGNTDQTNRQLEHLIDQIVKDRPEFDGMTPDQFIISAAFAFITDQGWNEEDFYGYNHEEKKPTGVDSAILGSHYHSTHGSQSPIMTICEKYVWQARNVLSGFLADRLLFCDDHEPTRISDYGLLDNFIVPSQELSQIDPDNIPDEQPWHIPEKDIVIIDGDYNSKENVIRSVIGAPDVNWENWIFLDNYMQKYRVESCDLLALEGFSCFYGPSGVETCLFISSILISIDNLQQFLDMISTDPSLAKSVSNPTEWMGGVNTSCYITPKEICWFPWNKRYNSRFVEYFPGMEMQSAVDRCCYNHQEYGDVYFDLPSAPIRNLLQLCNSDGYLFYNSEKKIKAEYCIAGEKWGTFQDYLLVDRKEILKKVNDSGITLVWVMRELRRPDGKAREKFGEFYAEKDHCSIGYIEKEIFITKPIFSSKESNVRNR